MQGRRGAEKRQGECWGRALKDDNIRPFSCAKPGHDATQSRVEIQTEKQGSFKQHTHANNTTGCKKMIIIK